jgi:hypothetical protein
MYSKLAVLIIFMVAPEAVWGADLPYYSVEKWCDIVANTGGSRSEMIYGGCIRQEQTAYDSLKEK